VRAYTALLQGCAWIAGIVIGLMAVAVTFDVLSRNLGWGNTGGVVELSEYSLPVATLLVAPWLLRRNEHVRMDALLIALPAVAARVIERCANVLGMMICAVFVWFSLKLIMDSARLGSMVVKTLSIPEWWQYALMPVCFTLLAIEFALRLRA
jgi:TRAP-type transport system small permease protein